MPRMSLYAYKCENCGKITEFIRKSSGGDWRPECPFCGSNNMSGLNAPAHKASREGTGRKVSDDGALSQLGRMKETHRRRADNTGKGDGWFSNLFVG